MRERRGYWIDRGNWSWYVSFLMLTGLALVAVLPRGGRLVELTVAMNPESLFPVVYVLLLSIYAVNFGQAQIGWRKRYAARPLGHLCHLGAHLLLLLGLSLPYWFVFQRVTYLPWVRVAGVLLYLTVYALVLGAFGWALGTLRRSEIFQFNMKYLILMAFLIGTLFALQPLSPFLLSRVLLDPATAPGNATRFVALGVGGLLLMGTGLSAWAAHRLRVEADTIQQ